MKSICELFTEQGVLEKRAGVMVNRPGLFFVEDENDLQFYVNMAARIGVECSGMKRPVCQNKDRAGTLCLRKNPKLLKGRGRLMVFCGGFVAEAADEDTLADLTEYLVCKFPIAPAGGLLALQQALETEFGGPVCFKDVELLLPEGSVLWVKFEVSGTVIERSGETVSGADAFEEETVENKGKTSYENVKPMLSQKLDRRICLEEIEALSPQCGIEPFLALALWESLSNFETVYPLSTACRDEAASCICFREGEQAELLVEEKALIFCGRGDGFSRLLDGYMSREEEFAHQEWLTDLEALAGGKKDLGQIATVLTMDGGEKTAILTKEYTAGVPDEDALDAYLAEKAGLPVDRKRCQNGKEMKRWEFDFSWEGKDLWELFEKAALPSIEPGDCIEISGRLSEDLDVRRRLGERLQLAVQGAGARVEDISLIRSYKSGSSWIEESVIPRLKLCGDVKKIVIEFETFVNELGEELFEDESLPDYGIHGDHPQKWFDISTRWLQELFPVDEVLAKELLLSTDDVEFRKTKGAAHTYCLKAYNGKGEELLQDSFDVKYTEKDYMSRYPSIGKTHVTTGWLLVKRNGQVLVDERIVTDIEKAWEAIETQVLPQLETALVSKYTLSGLPAAQPLFNRLQIRASLSEVDYDTGIREERMSTLESMQEDFYFYLLDWFKTFGERECSAALDNVGLILPEFFNEKEKDGHLEVILYEDCGTDAGCCLGGHWKKIPEGEVKLTPERFSIEADQVTLQVKISTSEEEDEVFKRLEVLDEMLERGILSYYPDSSWKIRIKGTSREQTLLIASAKERVCRLSEQEKERILRNDVIDYKVYQELLAYYSRHKELKIRPLETSFQGRTLFYLSYMKKEPDVLYREEKLKTNRLTVLFNGRHHGNEASSLNSAFLLLDQCLEREDLQELCSRVNLITLPWENIDGGELHCMVYKDHPKWLCHPARYNSAGFEFRKDYNNPDTIYGEARAVKKLWSRWLFDVITDNHGFEGHETTQPFSGYSSPWYKSFWIPRALYYGYIWFDKSNENTISFGNKVRTQVSDFINEDPEIRERNRICRERFWKYAEQWFPDRFHTDASQDVIFYWMETTMQKRPSNFNLERPEVTTLDWTTEVSDETVTGDEMWLNVRAHLISDLALLQVLKETELIQECRVTEKEGQSVYQSFRRRPLW